MGDEVSVQDRLPFSEAKQLALLGHLLVNERFFLQARNKLDPAWFIDWSCSKLFAAKIKFYNKHNRVPSEPELKEHPALLSEETGVRNKLYSMMTLAIHQTQFFGLDALAPELTDWLRARLYAKHIDRSAKLFNAQKLPEAYAEIKAVNKQIDEIQFDNDQEEQFGDYRSFFEQQKRAKLNCLTFGYSLLDEKLLPDGVKGSLLPGDTTILLAPTNIGKTTTMITVAVHNIVRKKAVLLLTHEGRPEDIKEKIWCSTVSVLQSRRATKVLRKQAEQAGQDAQSLLAPAIACHKSHLYALSDSNDPVLDLALTKCIAEYLTYVPYNKAGATVEEVEQIIRKKQEERIAKTGKGYDLLVCDYPSKLTTEQARQGNFQYRHIETHVYNIFVQLALEYKFHSLLAIQTNRTGSKKNRGHKSKWDDTGDASRLLTMEDVAESWGPMTVATNVISINRDERAMAKNRLTFYICKSRSNETGWAVVCHSDYASSVTHSPELGGTAYRSSHTMVEKIDELLTQFRDREIPSMVVARETS